MANRRAERIASAVQQEVARLLHSDVKDPRVGVISVTEVTMNQDLSVATVRYLPLNGAGDRKAIAEGLKQAAKHMRGPVGRALGIRHAPELRFEIDRNLEYAMHMQEVLANLPKPADEAAPLDDAVGADGIEDAETEQVEKE